MKHEKLTIRLSQAEALVLFEWLARSDGTEILKTEFPAEQKVLWSLEAQLEAQVQVFAPNYKDLLEQARAQVDLAE
jgi:hypothetical protein